jgi:hypothetical protein
MQPGLAALDQGYSCFGATRLGEHGSRDDRDDPGNPSLAALDQGYSCFGAMRLGEHGSRDDGCLAQSNSHGRSRPRRVAPS